jgi:hypothetical protein
MSMRSYELAVPDAGEIVMSTKPVVLTGVGGVIVTVPALHD